MAGCALRASPPPPAGLSYDWILSPSKNGWDCNVSHSKPKFWPQKMFAQCFGKISMTGSWEGPVRGLQNQFSKRSCNKWRINQFGYIKCTVAVYRKCETWETDMPMKKMLRMMCYCSSAAESHCRWMLQLDMATLEYTNIIHTNIIQRAVQQSVVDFSVPLFAY